MNLLRTRTTAVGENSTGTPKTDKDGFMEAAEGEIPFD